jgi:hypothetical protein
MLQLKDTEMDQNPGVQLLLCCTTAVQQTFPKPKKSVLNYAEYYLEHAPNYEENYLKPSPNYAEKHSI